VREGENDLKTAHGFNSRCSCLHGAVRDEAEAFRLISLFIDKHFRADDTPEWGKERGQVSIRKISREVVDKEVRSDRP
jgi:hypothetical protein